MQYQTGLTGRFSSFNWADSTTAVHLASQTQNLCIRQEAGYCCVQYQVLDIPCQLLNLSISYTSRTFRRIAVSSVALKDLGWSWNTYVGNLCWTIYLGFPMSNIGFQCRNSKSNLGFPKLGNQLLMLFYKRIVLTKNTRNHKVHD